jgi:hypothetical protein
MRHAPRDVRRSSSGSDSRRPALRLACLAGCLAAALLGIAGCATSQSTQKKEEATPDQPQKKRARHDNLSRQGKQVDTYDLNEDGKPDQWVIRSQSGDVVREERDMNFDGKVDLWQYPGPDGDIVEEEMDLDLDGTVDLIAFYKDGTVRRKKIAVSFKEDFSIVKIYDKKGQLLRVERDEDDDGRTDVWEYYDDQGDRERIGWDDNGDGVPDTFNQLP